MAEAKHEVEPQLLTDDSPASLRAVEYTGKMIGHRRGFRIYLLCLLPPLPPVLLEFGGSEDPRKEQVLETELRRHQQQWINSAKQSAEPSVEVVAKTLQKAGVPSRNIVREFSYPTEARDAARTILEFADAQNCHTVVLGHKAHSWFRELAGGDLTEHILHHASGVSVWVVQ